MDDDSALTVLTTEVVGEAVEAETVLVIAVAVDDKVIGINDEVALVIVSLGLTVVATISSTAIKPL